MQPKPNKEIVRFFKNLQLGMSLKKDMPDYTKVFQLGVVEGNLIGVSTDFTRLCKVAISDVLPADANIRFDTFDGKWISPILRALGTSGESIIDFGSMVGNHYNMNFPLVIVMDVSLKIHLCTIAELIEYPDWQDRIAGYEVTKSTPGVSKEWLLGCIEKKFGPVLRTESAGYVKMNDSLYDVNIIKDGVERMDDTFTVTYLNMNARFQDKELEEVTGVSFKSPSFSYLPAPCDYKGKKKASIKEFVEIDVG